MDPNVGTLAGFDIDQVVDETDKYYPFTEVEARLRGLIAAAIDMTEWPEYWNEIPANIRSNISSWLTNLVSTLNEIAAHRNEKAWLETNYDSKVSEIRSWGDSLYPDFIRGIREYKNSRDDVRIRIDAQLKEIEKAAKQATQKSRLVAEVATTASAGKLYEYFDELVVGESYERISSKRSWHNPIRYLEFKRWWARWQFFAEGKRGYEAEARKWLVGILLSVGVTTWLANRSFRGVDLTKLTLNEVFARAFLIAAPAYVIRFCVRNYNAVKHQAVFNRHKGMVLKTMLALLSREEVGDEVKQKVIVESVKSVFSEGETGYLTRRDGAGSGDTVFDLPIPTAKI